MIHERRLRIIAGFFIVWGCAIAMEAVTLSLLWGETWSRSNHVFSKLVFMIGLSCQLIFQGPSRSEVMERLRRRSGAEACRLDRVYLFFNIDRTVRVVIVVVLLWIVGALMGLVNGQGAWPLTGTAVFLALIAGLRTVVIFARVSAGRFGATQYEARELLVFLSGMYKSSQAQFDPPGRLRRLVEVAEPVTAPHNAQVAL
jgi:hypothetical protein